MGFKITDKIHQWAEKNIDAMDRALNRLSVDVERAAKNRVPVSAGGGQLKSSGSHRKAGILKYVVEFNKEYARFQEFGGDEKRVVRNYTTPGTGKFYLRDAGASVAKKAVDYFKQEGGSIRI